MTRVLFKVPYDFIEGSRGYRNLDSATHNSDESKATETSKVTKGNFN